ncbi:mucoidy inhibitor MuiA family protein [Ferruginibacter albus]|uniref:mucoidy inhibitor MuiA family protein n=1 Tax=Ferruginibacter albus TaxID=2875540 RepID=UPI001CC5CCC5|nr:mucoidy inhibitor MuiA family protein [Ferruginibacter albus]UAY53299.1 mucoidy inhibitor MuiA family protein [Ferruginibacter albus]
MKRYYFLLLLFVYSNVKATDDSIIVSAQLKNVVVYKAGAEMTHISTATLKQGNNELIIEGISNQLDINSVQIKSDDAVTIMGIEFSNNYLISPGITPRVQFLQDSINSVQKDIDEIEMAISNYTALLEVLNTNKEVKGEQTGLSVAELIKLMDYYKAKSLEINTALAKLNKSKEKLQLNLQKLQEQVDEEQSKNVSTAGRLSIQLTAALAGKYSFTISYITQNAWWTPFYDVRIENVKSPMKLVYKAKISQTTGIDWKQVKLSLSTSMPSQWNVAPELKPWFIRYVNPVSVMDKQVNQVVVNVGYQTQKIKDASGAVSQVRSGTIANLSTSDPALLLQGRVAGVDVINESTGNSSQIAIRGVSSLNNPDPLYIVNGVQMNSLDAINLDPKAIKKMEVLKDANATAIYGAAAAGGVILITLNDGLDDYISISDNTLDLNFDIDIPYDVPSNGKVQTALLKTVNVPAIYTDYAVPKLDKDAYLLAQIPGWNKLNLLPGEASIIVENTYIGKSFIDPNSVLDTLKLTLGRDKRVVVKRDNISDVSSVKFLGSNKVQKFTYEITVKNNKNDSVSVSLKDQYPISTDKDIEVQLLDNSNAIVNEESGLLSWNLKLAPGENKKLRFSFSIKCPKSKTVL